MTLQVHSLHVHATARLAERHLAVVAEGHSRPNLLLRAALTAVRLLRSQLLVNAEVLDQLHVNEVGGEALGPAGHRRDARADGALDAVFVLLSRFLAEVSSRRFALFQAARAEGVQAGQRLGRVEEVVADGAAQLVAHSPNGWIIRLRHLKKKHASDAMTFDPM